MSMRMNPPQPRKLLACTLVGLTLVTGCVSTSPARQGTPMSLEQTKQDLVGEWVSLAPEIRPSATKNPDGGMRPFYITRNFKLLGNDIYEMTFFNTPELNVQQR